MPETFFWVMDVFLALILLALGFAAGRFHARREIPPVSPREVQLSHELLRLRGYIRWLEQWQPAPPPTTSIEAPANHEQRV